MKLLIKKVFHKFHNAQIHVQVSRVTHGKKYRRSLNIRDLLDDI